MEKNLYENSIVILKQKPKCIKQHLGAFNTKMKEKHSEEDVSANERSMTFYSVVK